jgi:hypothetical protein
MSGSTRSPRSAREVDGEAVAGAGAADGGSERSAAERVRFDGETPPAFERDLRSLGDVARNPLRRPLATVVAALVVCALGYQSWLVAAAAGPVAGLLAVAAVAVAYAVAERLWAVQHRCMVAELAAADELDRIR